MPTESLTILVADGDDHESTLGRMCARAFESLGHEVSYFDTHLATIPIVGWTRGVNDLRSRFIERCLAVDPDLVLVIKGQYFARSDIEAAKTNCDGVFCNWNPDNPFLARARDRRLERFLDALPGYDEVFIWSDELFDDFKQEGIDDVHELAFGFDRTIHRPVDPDPNKGADMVFVGQYSEKRERYLSALSDTDIELAIYGNGWKWNCFDWFLRRSHRSDAVFGEAYAELYCSSSIGINIVADHNLEAFNMRSFEIPATETLMLTTRTERQVDVFGDGDGIVCFDDPEDFCEKAEYYLSHETEREEIARRGRELVQGHSYEDRMQRVIDVAL